MVAQGGNGGRPGPVGGGWWGCKQPLGEGKGKEVLGCSETSSVRYKVRKAVS